MLESPAFTVLSLSAHRVMNRLEVELMRHKGKPEENGNLEPNPFALNRRGIPESGIE